MFLLTDSTLQKSSGAGAGFYIMAWLPLAVIIVFAVRGIMQQRKKQ